MQYTMTTRTGRTCDTRLDYWHIAKKDNVCRVLLCRAYVKRQAWKRQFLHFNDWSLDWLRDDVHLCYLRRSPVDSASAATNTGSRRLTLAHLEHKE